MVFVVTFAEGVNIYSMLEQIYDKIHRQDNISILKYVYYTLLPRSHERVGNSQCFGVTR